MMTRFSVKNYKCLADVSVPLTPIHVLIGQNDAGKTSFLEAMLALSRMATGQQSIPFPDRWNTGEVVFKGADIPEIEMSAVWNQMGGIAESDYEIKVRQPAAGRVKQTYRQDSVECSDRSPLESLATAQMYRFDAKVMAVPATIDHRRRFRMDADGFGLSTLLDDLLGHDPKAFLKVRDQFCSYFPQFETVRVIVERAARREYHDTGIHSTQESEGKGMQFVLKGGKQISAQHASEGAILFLGFLALASTPQPPRILLIEEPERGIYPLRLKEIVDLLRQLSHARPDSPQIIMTTHSPYLISFFQPEEVTFMSRQPDGSVRARPLRDAPNIKERLGDEFYLGELWYNLTEEELFGDVQPSGNP